MPLPGPLPGSTRAAIDSLQKQINRLNRKPGGGALGYAEVTVAFPTPLISNGVAFTATDSSVDRSEGSPDVTASGGDVGYGIGLYVVNATLSIDPSTNTAASDVHEVFYSGDQILGPLAACIIGTDTRVVSLQGSYLLDSPASGTPSIYVTCTGGTNREYALSGFGYTNRVSLYITRFAPP